MIGAPLPYAQGTFGEYCVVSEFHVAPKPNNLSHVEGSWHASIELNSPLTILPLQLLPSLMPRSQPWMRCTTPICCKDRSQGPSPCSVLQVAWAQQRSNCSSPSHHRARTVPSLPSLVLALHTLHASNNCCRAVFVLWLVDPNSHSPLLAVHSRPL